MHTPVLLQEVITYLDPQKGESVIDGTVGLGGHAKKLCSLVGEQGRVLGIDQDEKALTHAEKTLEGCRSEVVRGNFKDMKELAHSVGIEKAQKILLDIGLSSLQLADISRGFSFKEDSPLDMRFGEGARYTAQEIVNSWTTDELVQIFEEYGEERFSERIAKGIVEARKEKEIRTTYELVEIIESAVPYFYTKRKIHPATKTFQALRIAVNDELSALLSVLPQAWELLEKQGRLAVISFHSLEDRIVKNFYKDKKKEGVGIVLTKKPIRASREEIIQNPRSRSALLRVIEKK